MQLPNKPFHNFRALYKWYNTIWLGLKVLWTAFIGGILGSASPRLLYSSNHHSSQSFIQLKTDWAQDAWLQWPYENWCFHIDIGRCLKSFKTRVNPLIYFLFLQFQAFPFLPSRSAFCPSDPTRRTSRPTPLKTGTTTGPPSRNTFPQPTCAQLSKSGLNLCFFLSLLKQRV